MRKVERSKKLRLSNLLDEKSNPPSFKKEGEKERKPSELKHISNWRKRNQNENP